MANIISNGKRWWPTTSLVLELWKSPESEASLAKGIPMWVLPLFAKQNPGKYRYRYRGPSQPGYDRPQSHTVREFAETWAIYNR